MYRKISYSDDHVRVVLVRAWQNSRHSTHANFHLTIPVKEFDVLQYYTAEKGIHEGIFYAACREYNTTTYFKRMELSTTYQWSTSVYLSSQTKCSVYGKTTVLIMRWTRGNLVQSIPFVDANRDDDARSCPGTAVHTSGAHFNRSHP